MGWRGRGLCLYTVSVGKFGRGVCVCDHADTEGFQVG